MTGYAEKGLFITGCGGSGKNKGGLIDKGIGAIIVGRIERGGEVKLFFMVVNLIGLIEC